MRGWDINLALCNLIQPVSHCVSIAYLILLHVQGLAKLVWSYAVRRVRRDTWTGWRPCVFRLDVT